MRSQRMVILAVWTLTAAIVSAGIVYLGSNTEPYRARWPLGGLSGAALGGAGGLLALWVWGNRRGSLLIAFLCGFVIGVGASMFVSGK
jgi:hypothetical protein